MAKNKIEEKGNKKRKKLAVCIAASALSFVLAVMGVLQLGCVYTKNTWEAYRPDYEKTDISSILAKQTLAEEDYELLYRQTGLTKLGIDGYLAKGDKQGILDTQEFFFEDYEVITGEPAPETNWVLERTEIYVPKTADELFDNEPFAQKLLVLSGPEKMGGVIFPPYRNKPGNEVKRIMSRMPLIRSSNFVKWQKQIHGEDDGGGGNDA